MATEAFISNQILTWARTRLNLSLTEAAAKIKVDPERLEAWEMGSGRPTLRQAQSLADQLDIPFGYLFLATPPQEKFPLPDLRTLSDTSLQQPSTDLWAVVADALEKQEWFREYLSEEGSSALDFVGKFSPNADPKTVAADVAEVLGINDSLRESALSWEHFLRLFIGKCEGAGIIVLRSGVVGNNNNRKLSVKEFRGFAIADVLAPLVFLNSQDAKAAQVFTLAHEVAHLWIGESGVSNPDYRRRASDQGNSTESACNRIAAELLVPEQELLALWDGESSTDNNVRRLIRRFRVSAVVVLRRAYEAALVTRHEFWEHYDEMLARQQEPRGESGGNFYFNLLARNSPRLVRSVMTSVDEGKTLHRDAARLLNIKVSTLDGLANHLRDASNG